MSIYRELYFYLFAALADAVDLLVRAQQTAEERVLDAAQGLGNKRFPHLEQGAENFFAKTY